MSDLSAPAPPGPAAASRRAGWLNRLAASPKFQRLANRLPVLRRISRREGEALFDLMAGFVYSQVLAALVTLNILDRLAEGPRDATGIAALCGLPPDRALVLLRAGVALGLLRRKRTGRFALTPRGAVLQASPGLSAMVRHHAMLYRDLADPAAFFRDGGDTELAAFWPYVFGAGAAEDPAQARAYSRLMADSQAYVAEETLRAVSLRDVAHLMDVGGGTGMFLQAAGAAWPHLDRTLVDLPGVIDAARARFAECGASPPALHPASFREDPLPAGADAISLVRVLYDHSDDTVRGLLGRVHDALPPGGRVIVSEPMLGDPRPERAGDGYFAIYTLAMGTGQTRAPSRIAALLAESGFGRIDMPRVRRRFLTAVVTARKPE